MAYNAKWHKTSWKFNEGWAYFLRDFKKLMYEYDDETKFEKLWNVMLSTYKVNKSSWLDGIYKVKEKWAKCYMKTAFTIGMRSTQLSESLNSDLKDYLKADLDIIQFFKHFERVVNDKRYNELQAEYHAREKLPRMRVKTSPILRQAAKAYTPIIFELFQEEWEKTFEACIKHRNEGDTMRDYLVTIVGQEGEYRVTANQSDQSMSCNCRNFEKIGFLCCHTLKVLDVMDIKSIPEKYIMKRWSRDARAGSINESKRNKVQGNVKLNVNDRYRNLCPKLVSLASRASDYEEGYLLVDKACAKLTKQLDDIIKKHGGSNGIPQVNLSISNNDCVDRRDSINKRDARKGGRRPKSWIEKQQKKKKVSNKETSLKDHESASQDQFHVYKGIETPQTVAWMNYDHEDMLQDRSQNSFTNLLMGIGGSNIRHSTPPIALSQESAIFGGVHFGYTPSALRNMSIGQVPPPIESVSTSQIPQPLGEFSSERN